MTKLLTFDRSLLDKQVFSLLTTITLSFFFIACQSQPQMYQPIPAERYFADSPALPVAQACQRDDAEGVVQALQTTHVSPNIVGKQGMSLLLLAMSNRSTRAVEALLTHGADPNLQTELGLARQPVQPVALAAGGNVPGLLRLLLTHGGNPNSRFNGLGALFHAASHQRSDHLRLLLDHGADINGVNEEGESIVVYLTGARKFEPAAYLIERGADINKPSPMGYTVAFNLQEQGFIYKPGDPFYPIVLKLKHLLEAKGVHFPVPSPLITRYAQERVENAQRRAWERTAEGRRWLDPIRAAERAREAMQNPGENYNKAMELRLKAEAAFQAWRKTQPGWVPSVNYLSNYYEDPPSLAHEEADMRQRQARFEADSARWAEQARAIK